jgi:hypothetical protein
MTIRITIFLILALTVTVATLFTVLRTEQGV